MDALFEIVSRVASLAGMIYLAALCGVGVLLSGLGFSGTWLVVLAGVSAFLMPGRAFPGLGTVLLFTYLAVLVEIAEYVLTFWGVKRQHGSTRAGVVALAGSMLGALVGSILPVPIFGAIVGIPVGGFFAVYAYERSRNRGIGGSLRVAAGVLLARFGVILMKLTITLSMTVWLFAGILRS